MIIANLFYTIMAYDDFLTYRIQLALGLNPGAKSSKTSRNH
jgi:hypothetical protein